MDKNNFKGIFTAVVTPFNNDGSVDIDSFIRLLTLQQNADGIIIAGTTGEGCCIESQELSLLIKTAKSVLPKMLIIAATGTNSTDKALYLQEVAQNAGAHAHLSIVPYYNKPTQKGLFAHFSALSRASSLPIVMYNNPARVIINLELPTIQSLMLECENIIGIKEGNPDLDRLKNLIAMIKEHKKDFVVLGCEDEAFLPFLQAGASGMMSTISNISLFEMQTLLKAFNNNEHDYVAKIADRLKSLSQLMFSHTSPIPIKTVLANLNLIKPNWRLPLCALETQEQINLLNKFKDFEWLNLVKEVSKK